MKPGRPVGTFKGKHPTSISGKKTPLYVKWIGIIQRCSNPKSHIWKYYGGRGITVCERWLGRNGFDNFVDDVGTPPKGASLDRINNDGNYEPDNVRWATAKEQCANRRKGGPPIDPSSLRQKARAVGLSYHLVYLRIKRGWTEEKALSTPVLPAGRPIGWRYERDGVEVVPVA